MKDKKYLGDSVYISHDDYHIILTTENGYGPSNTILLEPHLVPLIQNYLTDLIKPKSEPDIKKL